MSRTACRNLGVPIVVLGLTALCAPSGQAWGLSIDAGGTVTDWNVRPFPSGANVSERHFGWAPASAPYPTRWLEQNNYAPVSYPSGIGYVPSPGGSNGEKIDLEAIYARINTSLPTPSLQVLLVASMDDHTFYSPWNRWYRLGDLFIDVNADGTYDYVVATTNWDNAGLQPWQAYDPAANTYRTFNHGAAPGSVYGINYPPGSTIADPGSVVTIVGPTVGGYAENPSVEAMVRPWAVDQDHATPLVIDGQQAVATLTKATYDYGSSVLGGGFWPDDEYLGTGVARNEDATWFFEYTLPLSWIAPGADPQAFSVGSLGFHITVECGNDVLDLPGMPPVPTGEVPESMTVCGIMLGVGGLVAYVRRRNRAADR